MKPLITLLAAGGLLIASQHPAQAQIIYDDGNYCTPSRICYFGGGYYGWPGNVWYAPSWGFGPSYFGGYYYRPWRGYYRRWHGGWGNGYYRRGWGRGHGWSHGHGGWHGHH